MAEDLKPCPFCGSSDVARVQRDPVPLRWLGVACNGCGAQSRLSAHQDRADTAWNRRAPAPAPVKADTAAEGWVLVPREPTEAMIDAPRGLIMYFNSPPGESYPLGQHTKSGGYGEGYAHLLTDREKRMHSFPKAHQATLIFRAMIAAAPPPTEGGV